MSTKVKIGIAAVIVSALVALIVLDQKSTSTSDQKSPGPGDGSQVTIGAPPGVPRAQATLLDGTSEPGEETTAPRPKPAIPDRPAPGKPPAEEYVVVPGDTFEKISQKKWGDGKWSSMIAEANPNVKPTALRPGQKIIIPAKPEKKAEEKKDVVKSETVPVDPKKDDTAVKKDPIFQNNPKGERIYVVQPGDTLSGISVKVYNTSRHVDKIVETNKIEDPSLLYVGMKLVMPDLPKKEAAPTGGTANTAAPGKKTYTVQPGDNLWKIASRIAGDKSVEEMERIIVGLNSEKLKTISDVLRAGWQLVMPE